MRRGVLSGASGGYDGCGGFGARDGDHRVAVPVGTVAGRVVGIVRCRARVGIVVVLLGTGGIRRRGVVERDGRGRGVGWRARGRCLVGCRLPWLVGFWMEMRGCYRVLRSWNETVWGLLVEAGCGVRCGQAAQVLTGVVCLRLSIADG